MKRVVLLNLAIILAMAHLQGADTIQVKPNQVPILIDRADNVLFYVRVNARESKELNEVNLRFANSMNMVEVEAVKLYYSGTEAPQRFGEVHYAPVRQYVSRDRKSTRLNSSH